MKQCGVQGCDKPYKAKGWCNNHYRRWLRGNDPHIPAYLPMPECFWSKVRKSDGCWEWTATKDRLGYGNFGLNGQMKIAHRIAFELEVGPIPEGLEIDHRCHNRACVNPAHLRAVTRKQNVQNLSGPRRTSATGVLNVHWHKPSKAYRVKVRHDGREYIGGYFSDLEEAAKAARELRLSLFTHNDLDRRPAA